MKRETLDRVVRWRAQALLYVAILIIIVGFCISYYLIVYGIWPPQNAGEFGEMFGGLNTLFSGLAFGGLLATLYFQSTTFRQQHFEATFFQMLELRNTLINSMEIGQITGRACFVEWKRILMTKYGQRCTNAADKKDISLGVQAFVDTHSLYPEEMSHYFRHLYNIMKLVKNAKVPNKRFYTNLLRAQLSSAELILLFYNCRSDLGNRKFLPLVVEFGMLKNLTELLHRAHFSEIDLTAFQLELEPKLAERVQRLFPGRANRILRDHVVLKFHDLHDWRAMYFFPREVIRKHVRQTSGTVFNRLETILDTADNLQHLFESSSELVGLKHKADYLAVARDVVLGYLAQSLYYLLKSELRTGLIAKNVEQGPHRREFLGLAMLHLSDQRWLIGPAKNTLKQLSAETFRDVHMFLSAERLLRSLKINYDEARAKQDFAAAEKIESTAKKIAAKFKAPAGEYVFDRIYQEIRKSMRQEPCEIEQLLNVLKVHVTP